MNRVKHMRFFGALVFTCILIAVLLSSTTWAESDGQSKPAYVVVLQDGTKIPAKRKPISAFGTFRYVDADGRTRTLPVSTVDLESTRVANVGVVPEGRTGTLSVSGSTSVQPGAPEESVDAVEEAVRKRSPQVKVYSATWCGYCRSLKKFLAAEGIAASVIDVDTLPEPEQKRLKKEMKRLTGKVSFPTVVIGDAVIAGFSPNWIRQALGP